MYRRGGFRGIIGGLLLVFSVFLTQMIFIADANAEYGVGTGVVTGGGECASFTGTSRYYWDTCYGFSWQYYEWPKNSDGTPVNSPVQFFCTANACCDVGDTVCRSQYSTNHSVDVVDKDCGKPEYGGGFWFLGYEAASPNRDFGGGSGDSRNIGVQVGKPKVEQLAKWVSVPDVTPISTVGLYPIGTKTSTNSAFVSYRSDDYITLTHTDLINKGYSPRKCSQLSASNKTQCASWYPFWPRINVNGTYQAVEAKYYGTTYEAYEAFKANTALASSTNFKDVNWFCASETGAFSGRSAVKVNSGSYEYSDWTNSSSSHPTKSYSSTVDVTDKVTVTFYHEVKGAGTTKLNFQVDQSSLRTGQWVNGSNINYSNTSATTAKSYTRSREVLASEISSSGTKICDTMTFAGNIQSTACVTLKAQVDIPKNNVNGTSSVSGGGSSATSSATNGGNGTEQSITVHVPVIKDTTSTTLTFTHSVTALKSVSGVAQTAKDIKYSIAQSVSGSGASATSYSLGTQTKSMTVAASLASDIFTAATPSITVSGITASTDYTVCQTLSVTYGGGNARTTKVCARIIGHQISSTSTIKNTGSGATQSTSTDGGTASLTAADVVVVSGTKTVTLNFTHTLSMTRHSGTTGAISANVGYSVTQSTSGSGATATTFSTASGTKTVTIANGSNSGSVTASSGNITVSDIKSGTDFTVCQTLTETYGGKSRTTKVCARVIGSSTSSWSSVKYGSNTAKSTSTNGATATETVNITVANGGTTSVKVTFDHGISYSSSIGSGSLSSTTSYKVTQWQDSGSASTVTSGSKTLTMTPSVPSPSSSVSSGEVTISGITNSTDTKVCQKLEATRDGNTRTTTACVRIVGNPVTGISAVSNALAGSKTSSSSNDTQTLNPVYVTVVPGSTGSVKVTFVHTAKITRTKDDSGTISTGNVAYTIEQTTSGLSNVTTFNKVSDTVNLTLAASSPSATAQLKSTEITISNVSASTNGTVCQKLTISGYTTTVCAQIKGRTFAVSGQSSVGNSSSDIKKNTGWKNDSTKVTADLGSVYSPYGGTSSKNVYFVHELRAQLSGNTYANMGTGDITYSVSRGSTSVVSDQKKSFTVSNGDATSAAVRTDTVSAQVANGSNTVCQKISFTYGTTTGSPEACATITGVPPTFSGKSAVTANGTSVENSTNGGTANLPTIELKVAQTKTVTQRIYFGHNMTATSTMSDAKGKSTGTMAYTVSRDYGSNTTGNFTGTFPSNDTTYSSAVGTSNDYVDVTVGPGETKTVCQTITFTGWSSKACATVKGILVLPDLKSQSSITYGARSATTDWADKNSATKSASISSTIYVPVREVEEGNGGKEISVKFVHNLMAQLVENMSWLNTGDVPYNITTTHNGTTMDVISGTFNHTVTMANISAITNINTNNWSLRVKQRDDINVCQAFTFSYKGANFSTTACARVVGIPADPQGRSAALVTGYEGQADTAWVNGRVSRHTVHVNDEVLSGNAIVFNHFIQLAGERTITIDHFTITNDYDSKLSSSGSVTYTGTNESSYSQYSFYTKGRPVNITSADALGMIQKGSACETLSFDYEGINYTSTACLDFEKDPPMYMEDDCPDLTTYHSATSGETLSYSYVKSNTKDAEGQVLIYAKPTDKITFTHCYYPGAQETRYTDADESPYRVSSNNGKTVIIPVRNAYIETVNDIEIKDKEDTDSFVYNNNNYDFSLYGQILRPSGRVYSGVVGNYKHTMFLSSETAITSNAVGGTLEQSLWTYTGSNLASGHDRANCGSNCLVYYKNGDDNNWYNPTKNTSASRAKSSAAQVIVPYNYITTARVDDPSDVVYPGDTMSGGNVKVDVLTRNNTLVGDNYATKTASSMVRLYTFYTENSSVGEGSDHTTDGSDVNACSYYSGLGFGSTCEKIGEVTDQVFNAASNIAGKVGEVVSGFDNVYNVPDLPAGSKVCMGVSVYPAASTNTEPSNGKTFVSKAYCRTVAKKPSFQIWGGSLYSAGDVKGTVATKYTIKGVNDDTYSPFKTPGADGINFGSWVEHAILANGLIRNVSSAAGTAYGLANMEVNAANPGGAVVKGNLASTDFCNRSRLSFANTTCSSGYAGKFGISGGSYTKTTIQQEYATKAEDAEKAAGVSRNSGNTWTTIDLSSPSSYTQIGNVRYTFIENGNLAITASDTLDNGITHVIYAKKNSMDSTGGNIVIYGTGAPISYGDGNYQDLSDIPQYVIIADGNLYIDRLVTRIDAILIAAGSTNTCAKFSGGTVTEATKDSRNEIQDLYCNQQLQINGVVVTGALKLYRIYGASAGLDSITPAEIINYSPSIYMWGDDNASTGNSGIHTTYQRELAPRQ